MQISLCIISVFMVGKNSQYSLLFPQRAILEAEQHDSGIERKTSEWERISREVQRQKKQEMHKDKANREQAMD